MKWHEQEVRMKLHILNSLARSQRALAVILESMADVAGSSQMVAKGLAEQIEAFSKYQRQIAVKMIGVKLRRRRYGKPAKPWLNRKLHVRKNRPVKRRNSSA
ncbi:hypothetical protein ACFQ88_16250 [Paenibacillus sp. NPDC056579]|uniref:hypothetical protein n=1 Tax=Paenibacillus sp. NPDC056579 TaxID=3345871 RepID=UPI0036B6094A